MEPNEVAMLVFEKCNGNLSLIRQVITHIHTLESSYLDVVLASKKDTIADLSAVIALQAQPKRTKSDYEFIAKKLEKQSESMTIEPTNIIKTYRKKAGVNDDTKNQ